MSRRAILAALALVLAAPAGARQGGVMAITGCNLGCSPGGASVSCSVSAVHENGVLEVRFSRAVDPASLDSSSFSIVDVGDGSVPQGALVLDPGDPTLVRFEPAFVFDAQGNLSYGLLPGRTYRVHVQGQGAGDPGPFVQSFDGLANYTRLSCTVQATLGVSAPGPLSCLGSGAGAGPCPCGPNNGGQGGCPSSANPLGAVLTLHDVQLAGPGGPRFSFVASGLPPGGPGIVPVVLFRAAAPAAATVFGDGLLCAAIPVTRIHTAASMGGAIGVSPLRHGGGGGSFTYQLWYRDGDPHCTPALFNTTNAVGLTWP
jgi:hypothetical protein